MLTAEERAISDALKESTADIDFDDAMLAEVVDRGHRLRWRKRTLGAAFAAGTIALAGAGVVQVWDRPDSGPVAAPEATASPTTPARPNAVMLEAFETTRSVVEPLLAVNDSRYREEQFQLALNNETGDAILYLPYTGRIDPTEVGVIDVEQLGTDAVSAARATPGAAPVVPVIGVALFDELSAVSARLFATRAQWQTEPNGVLWTVPEPDTVSIGVGVTALEVAANLPPTMQLASGATATIRIEKSSIHFE
ncbi:hypothetical protein [Jiangella alba]|uniref:Uncharacterized protein n=1 Tax=Jiangella alba TaxID=561176 RepID=A0A1H5N076_9ACTN|nr:hypothetical protein [Jiangella alba]SEE94261.1 hypothetical protein SAMN04488561_3537 [Jiangella alba]